MREFRYLAVGHFERSVDVILKLITGDGGVMFEENWEKRPTSLRLIMQGFEVALLIKNDQPIHGYAANTG